MSLKDYIDKELKLESFFNQLKDCEFKPITQSLYNEIYQIWKKWTVNEHLDISKEQFSYMELKLESSDAKGLKLHSPEAEDKFTKFQSKLKAPLSLHLNLEDGRAFIIKRNII